MTERRPSRAGIATTLVLEASILLGAAGCANPLDRFTPTKSPIPSSKPTPTLVTPEASIELGPISQEMVTRVARRSIGNFNNTLGLHLDENLAVSKVVLVNSLVEFQNILETEDENYIPQDESNHYAVTSNTKDKNGALTVYINKKALKIATEYLPRNALGNQALEQFIEDVLDHEYVHWSALEYPAHPDLSNILFKTMFANLSYIKGKKIENVMVDGAKIRFDADGIDSSAYQNLEEAEAWVISDYVIENDDNKEVVMNVTPEDIGVSGQVSLLIKLLRRMSNENIGIAIKDLALLRTQEGGREQWAQKMAEAFGKPSEDALFFAMSVLFTIETIDEQNFYELTGLK